MPLLIARVALGLFLVAHFGLQLPYAAALYSEAGMLPDPRLNPGAEAALSPLHRWDHPAVVRAAVAAMVALAAAYTVGFRTRTVGVLLGLGTAALWQRNVLTLNPSLAYLGFWFLVQAFAAPDPPGSLDRWLARRRGARGFADTLPADVTRALWVVFTVAYSYSGWTKLVSPAWQAGDAVGWLLAGPLGLDHPLARAVAALPPALLALATWGTVALELLAAPLACVPRLRPALWWAILALHVGLVALVDLRDISLAMIAVHLTLRAGPERRGGAAGAA